MSPGPRLWRRCPGCGGIRLATDYSRAPRQIVQFGPTVKRRCPSCIYEDILLSFRVVPSPEAEGQLRPKGRSYRRCRQCGVVSPASAFKRAPVDVAVLSMATSRVRCPGCGHVGPRMGFPTAAAPEQGPAS